ncbi:hypothetical protein L596_022714 [Steinernema carpocapsae]|uniref:Uncharacterized protein n=1 Tax=Steinernema carpocapsae TaxID=34508 RepID=A0A4U5MMK0_STECR|nr:hypothetical protein L596_022714 [Steinernema carpocapsae]
MCPKTASETDILCLVCWEIGWEIPFYGQESFYRSFGFDLPSFDVRLHELNGLYRITVARGSSAYHPCTEGVSKAI